jgi:ribulose-5-phosphate 4-epimerase/fuculose-1-phosphate aldolase
MRLAHLKAKADRYLCTATGVTFGDTAVENVVEMDLAGEQRGGDWKPSKEHRWHAGILAIRPEVHGVVHTHSTATMAFGILNQSPPHMTGQARFHLGKIQIVPYADAGSDRLRDLIVDVYKKDPDTRIVLLANHGLAATGPTLLEAYNRRRGRGGSAQAYLHCKPSGRNRSSTSRGIRPWRQNSASPRAGRISVDFDVLRAIANLCNFAQCSTCPLRDPRAEQEKSSSLHIAT